jgi:TRAP-type C4-dicarboxylate transport system permease small subunit
MADDEWTARVDAAGREPDRDGGKTMCDETEAELDVEGRMSLADYGPAGRALMRLSETLALLGGIILVVVTILTIVSVVGRTGFDVPILGDSEIVEVGVAYSVFSFLAYCQMRGANVIVDFFTARAPAVVRNGLDAVSNAVFAVVVCILTWRLAIGGVETYERADFSMFLNIPIWCGYLGAFVSCLVWAAACLYTAAHRLRLG